MSEDKESPKKGYALVEDLLAQKLVISSIAAALVQKGALSYQEASQLAMSVGASKDLRDRFPGLTKNIEEIFYFAKGFDQASGKSSDDQVEK